MLKLFAFAAAFRGQNMNKWWSFQHKNPSEMKRSFSHDRGTISNGDESGFSYWGMLRGGAIIPPIQCSSKPNVLNEHPPPNQQRSLFSPKSRNFSIGFVLSAPIVTGEMKLTHRICDLPCNPHGGQLWNCIFYDEMKLEFRGKIDFLWKFWQILIKEDWATLARLLCAGRRLLS